jgi:hypothetical protein
MCWLTIGNLSSLAVIIYYITGHISEDELVGEPEYKIPIGIIREFSVSPLGWIAGGPLFYATCRFIEWRLKTSRKVQ